MCKLSNWGYENLEGVNYHRRDGEMCDLLTWLILRTLKNVGHVGVNVKDVRNPTWQMYDIPGKPLPRRHIFV